MFGHDLRLTGLGSTQHLTESLFRFLNLPVHGLPPV
jgi:hypothetical protein